MKLQMGDPMTTTTIHPTHHCFDDVLDHQVDLDRRDPTTAARQRIVHGICLFPEGGPRAGEAFAHAWVEDDTEDRVYEAGLLGGQKIWWSADRTLWRAAMRVQAMTRYTLAEARVKNWQHEHYGPWVPAYRALCGRNR